MSHVKSWNAALQREKATAHLKKDKKRHELSENEALLEIARHHLETMPCQCLGERFGVQSKVQNHKCFDYVFIHVLDLVF